MLIPIHNYTHTPDPLSHSPGLQVSECKNVSLENKNTVDMNKFNAIFIF